MSIEQNVGENVSSVKLKEERFCHSSAFLLFFFFHYGDVWAQVRNSGNNHVKSEQQLNYSDVSMVEVVSIKRISGYNEII